MRPTEFRTGNASDIISTLVSIYDTREVIVKELQILLAQKLLVVKDYDLEQEVRCSFQHRIDSSSCVFNPALSPCTCRRLCL